MAAAHGTLVAAQQSGSWAKPSRCSDLFPVEAMGIEPTNLLHAMQALYQLSYAPRWSLKTIRQPVQSWVPPPA